MAKDISELSVEELMALAKKKIDKQDDVKHLSDVHQFILAENLKRGEIPIPAFMIYNRYIKWVDSMNRIALSNQKFFREFKHYFTRTQDRYGIYYLMQANGFDLSAGNKAEGKRIFRNVKKSKAKKDEEKNKS